MKIYLHNQVKNSAFIMIRIICCIAFSIALQTVYGQKKKPDNESKVQSEFPDGTLAGLKFRSVGPALTSGRISDIVVHPKRPQEFFLAVASGGIWKTTNQGITFQPVFDSEGSYSIGCLAMAPSNPNAIWAGTGENNNQRSVAYGDGIYKSADGGQSWTNMGLENSEHIGMIAIHPENEAIVYVAAYGPLWNEGGDRGIYKTVDGGTTWSQVLNVSDNTGFNEVHMDPRNPNVLYATAHQRRRHVYTYIDGGPETAIYKSEDGGTLWRKLEKGLPDGDKGRIGMDISPVNPAWLYAIVAGNEDVGGFFRSKDRGESWEKMSDHQTSGNYYQEIFCDLKDPLKVYSMDTWLHHTVDGGKTFVETGEKSKHVDNHCMWQDPAYPDHWLVGCDGGLYETWNAAEDWRYFSNLPITQFYKLTLDNDEPFYNIYGGTQDNNTQGGPSRTLSKHGITNSDWIITNGGDGFQPQVDPENPDIVYGQAQYGWLIRYDRKSGERVGIQPVPNPDQKALRWNWDAPLIISPHNSKRLYFAANVIFKSEDRGDSWQQISNDLSRQEDRNSLRVMGRIWEAEAVAKNQSTSIYGNITSLDESPLISGLLYAGTDDGLIQVSDNDGESWKKYASFGGVPNRTYVNMLKASQHNENRVYAVFNNHKNGDFKPYLFRSDDRGVSWKAIMGNLPLRGSTYCVEEDHKDPNVLFVGTEFGAFYTHDGGTKWNRLAAGLPTIAVRDMEIQKRENDLVLATFGRSFYVLDDYDPLRHLNQNLLSKSAHVFDIKDALLYVESNHIGLRGKGSMGESFFTAQNPPFGAVFTYFVSDTLSTLKEQRQEQDKIAAKAGKDVAYPDIETLRTEDREEEPYLLFLIKNQEGDIVRKIKTESKTGIQRVSWNLRHASTSPIALKDPEIGRYSDPNEGMLALPGIYTVQLFKNQNGDFSALTEAKSFRVVPLDNQTLLAGDRAQVLAFQDSVAELQRSVEGAKRLYKENMEKLDFIEKAVVDYPTVPLEMLGDLQKLKDQQYLLKLQLFGDDTRSSREFETMPTLSDRAEYAAYTTWWNTAEPTHTARLQLRIASKEFEQALTQTNAVTLTLSEIEQRLVKMRVPYTPGRGGRWGED